MESTILLLIGVIFVATVVAVYLYARSKAVAEARRVRV
jgi:hypothetical protein